MATYTTNLNLAKPDYTDAADVGVINSNMDVIDTAVTAKVPKSGGTMTGDLTFTNLLGSNNGVTVESKVDATNYRALYNSTVKARLFAENNGGLLYLYSQNNRLGYISRTTDDLMTFTVFDGNGNARQMSLNASTNKVTANDFILTNNTSLSGLSDQIGNLIKHTTGTATTDAFGMVDIDVSHPIVGLKVTYNNAAYRAIQVRWRTTVGSNFEYKYLITGWDNTSPLASVTVNYDCLYINANLQ